jgi:hypothetical protein
MKLNINEIDITRKVWTRKSVLIVKNSINLIKYALKRISQHKGVLQKKEL